jgi:hypothetical protein
MQSEDQEMYIEACRLRHTEGEVKAAEEEVKAAEEAVTLVKEFISKDCTGNENGHDSDAAAAVASFGALAVAAVEDGT